jgi:hypothetical protein
MDKIDKTVSMFVPKAEINDVYKRMMLLTTREQYGDFMMKFEKELAKHRKE